MMMAKDAKGSESNGGRRETQKPTLSSITKNKISLYINSNVLKIQKCLNNYISDKSIINNWFVIFVFDN